MLRYAIRASAMALVASTSAVFVIAIGHAQGHLFAVRGVVVDPSGAVISDARVVFKGESGTIVSHTGSDGSVNVSLAAGQYVVTVHARGFATTKLVDFAVPGATADAFRVILKINQVNFGSGSDPGPGINVPTVPSELPNVTEDEPNRASLPLERPAIIKHRSMCCLYLWRCVASQQ